MNRLRCGQSSESDGQSLHIAGLGQPAGLRHSTAPNGARSGCGWTGSKEETRGGPGHRAEPDDDPRCTVGGWSRSVPTDNGNGTQAIPQQFAFSL
jgi:hypothetical protein